ncbi:MAG: LPS assembly protein LptD [Verrucomicrobia bacterium]|nr:LPS assembly protein LptD [Verrucomicrobiota bacterium]
MRLQILDLFLLVLLPMNLFAQTATPPTLLSPGPTPANNKGKEFNPLLPLQNTGNAGQAPVEINSEQTRFEGGIAVAEGNVVIRYGAVTIYCDYAEYNPETHEIVLRGNVRLYQDRYAFVADRAIYNLQTKALKMSDFGGPKQPFQINGDTVVSFKENEYTILNGFITTSDSSKPDYQLRARTIRIYSNDRIILSNVTLFVGRTPVFWFPYIYQSLNDQFSYNLAPGYNSVWGAYLLTSITFPIATNVSGTVHLDLRSLRGPALGMDANYHMGPNRETYGRLRLYGMFDQSPNINETALGRAPIDSGRYRILYQSRTYITDDLSAVVDFNKLSDQYFLQDFYPNIFAYDPQPDTYTQLVKRGEAYTLSALTRPQVNTFLETAERLPEVSWEVARTPLFNSPIFYEATTSAAELHRAFAATTGNLFIDLQSGSLNPDYEFFRFDSFHQLIFPHTYFGWLSLVPSAGVRGTYYSTTGSFTESDLSNPLPRGILVEHGGRLRWAFNANVEASFKLSRVFEGVQERWLGLDGLRHVIQPYADFSYVQPTVAPSKILPIDQYIPSAPLQAIDFPQFNSIDSLDHWTILRLGVQNRLQTRRNASTLNWLDVNSYFDVNFNNPLAQAIPPATTSVSRTNPVTPPRELFSNVFNRVRFQPVPWAYLSIDSQAPLLNSGFWAVTTAFDWIINPNIEFRLGHQYLQSNPFYQDTSELSFYTYLRLNDNWGFSVYEDYGFKTGLVNQQTYALHRDLSSWVGALGLNITNNGSGKHQIAVVLTFTLKDLPRFGLPINLDVGNALGE